MTYREFTVALDIDGEEYQRMYRGEAQSVLARDSQGRKIQFPAGSLRAFVTHDGVQGVFVIRVDDNNRLVDIRRKNR